MEILFIVLNDLTLLETIMEIFVKLNVRGATLLESEGMAKAILQNEGLSFLLRGPFEKMLPKATSNSKTIFTVIQDEGTAKKVVEEIQNSLSKSESSTIGFMFTMPVSGIYPLKKKSN